MTWLGTNAVSGWELTTTNWTNTVLGAVDRFFNADAVLFDNSSTNTNVVITATVQPRSVTVNSSSNYAFSGAGLIAGGASLAKSGSGTLVMGNANTFLGPVSITGGTLRQSAVGALGNSAGVTISGGQFDFAGFAPSSRTLSYSISGNGPDGRGAIINSGANVSASAISNVTLTADASIGAVGTGGDLGRMDIGLGYGLINGNGFKLTKSGPGFLDIRSATINLPEIIVAAGTVYSENFDNNLGAKVIVANGARLGGTGARLYTNTVDLLAGSTFFTAVLNSFSTWSGPINVLGQSAFGAATIASGAGAQDLRIVGPFNGSGNIVLSVAPLEFTGNNDATFSGNITVNATTLRMTTNGTAGSGVITNNSGTVEFNVFNNVAYNRNIYGPGGTVRKANTNLFQLAGAGGDQISDAQVLDVTGGVFDLNGRSEGLRGLTGNLGTFVTNSAGSLVSLVLTNPNANPHIYNGSIAGPITVVVRDSSARNSVLQSFTGTNTFTGGLVIDNGQLRSSGDWVLGAVPAGYDPANIIFRNNGAIQNNASTLFLHPNRGILLEGDVTFMAGFSAGNDIVVSGSISGPGRVLKGDGQRLILKNGNTFTGDTVFTNVAGVGQGTIRLDHSLALQNSTFDATGLGGNGTLDLNNMDVVIGMLKGSGATLANFNGRLTAGGNGQNGVFGSTLSGAGSLVKVGPGILTLTAANPYNGGTIVSNGTLLALGNLSGFGPLVVKSGATFGSPATVSGPVTVEAGGSVYPGASVGTLSVSNHFTVTAGALFYELASVNNTGGGINDLINVQSNLTLSGSTLVRFSFVNGAPALGVPYVLMTYAGALSGSAANLTANTRYTTTFDNSVAGQIRVTFTGAGGSNLVWSGSSTNNTWNLDTFTNFYNGLSLDTFKDADSVTFNDSGYAGAPVNLVGLLSPTALTISAAQDYTFAGVGHLNMAGSLVKLGAGKLTLANTNDFIGSFNVGAGTLSVALEESLGLAPVAAINQIFLPGGTFQAAGTFTLNSNRRIVVGPTNTAGSGAIEVTGTNVLSYAGVIGNNQFGVGTLVKRGSGRLSLQNANIYSGGTILSKGTLSLRNANALGTLGPITVGDASSGSDDLTLLLETSAGNLTLTRDINVSSLGSGVVTLGSTPLPLAAGANDMRFNGNIALTNRDLVLRSGGGNSTFFSGDILGTGNLIITNGSLTGDVGGGQAGNRVIWDNLPKSFTGDITILGGTVTPIYTNFTVLQMNTANIIRDTANVTVQANAVFRLNADENINGLTGAGRVRGVVSLRTLGVGANNASSVFNGVMENDPVNGGSLALTKLGSGALTLNGTNSYTGGTIAGAGTLALGSNGSLSNSTSLIVSNGAIFDVSAVSGGYVLMGNQTLSGFGTVLGSTTLASNATVNPGLLNVVGSLAVTGNLGINNSNRFNFELGSVPAGPGNDQIVVSGNLNVSGVSYITVNAVAPLAAGTYSLITCSGTKTSAGGAANFVLINNTASAMTLGENANAITLTVTTAGRSLVWAANFTNSLWDINTTTNWLNGGTLGGFLAGDGVLFDSTASNQTVTLNVTALASTVSLTGTTNYNFTGSGKISGAASIVQNSTSTNTIGLANDFSGSVTINGGVLRPNHATALGNTTGATIINPGGTLDVNNLNLGTELFVVSGAGYQGQGAIVNGTGSQINATRFVTLAGDTTFGGAARWDVRGASSAQQGYLSSGGLPYKLTKLGVNTVSIVDTLVDNALGDVDVLGGILSLETSSSGLGDPSRALRVGNNASFQLFALPIPLNKQIEMTNGSAIINASGANIIVGPINLLGSNFFNVGGTSLALSNSVSGAGSLWKGGGSTLLLAANNTYSGGAVVQAGAVTITGSEPNSGGYSNAATVNVGNFGNSGSIGGLITNNGTINLQRLDSSSFGAAVLGFGTINHVSGSGPVTLNGNITNANLNVRSGNNSILTLGPGTYSITNIAVGNTPSGWMNILPGATVGIPNQYFVGDASGGQTGVVVQTGGDVTIGNQFRLAHWPNNVSSYLLGGGTLSLTTVSASSPSGTTEQNGGFYIGIDGVGIFTQTNGALNVPGIVMDNRAGASTLGINTNTYILNGGTLNLGRWGFASPVATYQIRLGGGLITSSESWTSALTMTLTGTNGNTTVSPASGRTNQFDGVLAGLGGMNKGGLGEVVLASGANSFAGALNITAGTVRAPATFSGTGSSLGLRSGSRTVTVGSASTLLMTINNVLTGGGNSAANLPAITVNGGTLDSTRFNAIGHLNLNGGLLSQTASDGPGAYEGYQFLGNITVGGSSASTINSGSGRGNHLLGGGTNTFNVADATGDSSADLTVSNPLRDGSGDYGGIGSLLKNGAGTMRLTGANAYSGTTYVDAGILQVDGSLSTGPVLVNGGTLGGNGTIAGATIVASAGTLSPGASIGTLTFSGSVTLSGTTLMEIDRGAIPNADLVVAAALTNGGTLVVTNIGVSLMELDTFNLFDAASFNGTFASITLPALTGGLAWDLSQLYVDGTIRVVTPPSIVTSPVSQTVDCPGNVTFSVVAVGTPPLSYQWRSNGVAVSGATGTSLMLNNLNVASSGSFDVVVANGGGSATSTPASLIVQDTNAPVLICSTNIVAECTSSNGAVITFTASATDTCSGSVTPVCVPVSGSTFAIGTNLVTCTANDGTGNTNACTFTVTVLDTTPPTIVTCATNRTLSASATCLVPLPDLTTEIAATDICGPVVITQSPAAGTMLSLGATLVTFTATDPASNSVTCSATLTLVDDTQPTITCPANIVVQCDSNVPPSNFVGGSVSDNCDAAPVVTHLGDVVTGSCLKTIVRTYRATDVSGNTNDCAQTITVHDTTAPMLICPAPVSVQCPTNVPLPDVLLVTASDNCDSSPTVTYVGDVSTGVNPTIITRTYRATDVCGNTNDCVQIITVEDTTAPSITACALSSFIVGDTNGLAIVPDQRSQIIATDNCGVPIIIQVPAPGSMISTGVHVLTFTAIDSASNTSACTATLTIVAGALPPVILAQPQDATAECSSNATFTVSVDGTPPFAYQWFFGVSPIANATNDSLILSAVTAAQDGGYSVIITNDGGSITSRVARLTVVDTIAPSVTCPGPIHLKTTSTNGAVVSFAASASDGCTPSPAFACLPASGSLFPVGLTTVICTAVDSSGNSNSCSFAVTVLLASTASLLVNQPVPDIPSLGLASVLNVSSPIGSLSDVNVTLNISNGWNGDLFAYLVHESGYAVLLNRVGRTGSNPLGYSDAGLNVTLDDQATNDIHTYRLSLFGNHSTPLVGALTNSWQPDGRAEDPALVLDTMPRTAMLSAFNGMNPNGEWVLFVEDDATGDISTLVSWGLELCGTLGVSPTITAPPQNVIVDCGSNAVFNVIATGTGPVGYHWLRNGLPIPGANAATYAINNAHPTDNATYSVIVSNAFGAVTASATLVVNEPNLPVILTQPQSVTNNVGTTVSLSVAASSCSALSYQWCFGRTPLAGETNPTLTILNVQLVNQGGYTVKVSNAGGTTTSAVAVVTVNRPPVAQNNGGATIQGQALMIQVGKLLANDTDPDGDPLTVISVTASTNGGMVALGGGKVTYMPVPAFVGTDRFSYTISDGRGGTATADVEVLVVSGSLPSLNQVSLIPTPNGFLIRFAGIPGELYGIQRAPSVTGPWTTITTQTAPLHGIIHYEDVNPPVGSGFYRTVAQ